jgi:protein ImuB
VHGLRAHEDHRPEQAWRAETEVRTVASSQTVGFRPGWLLSQPIPLRGGITQIQTGPERIETGWWDGGDIRRDYYRVKTRLGQDAWAFRPCDEDGEFMLHGWFA